MVILWCIPAFVYGMFVIKFWERVIWDKPEQNLPIKEWVYLISIGWLITPVFLFLMFIMWLEESVFNR